jgi:hypothetical protein
MEDLQCPCETCQSKDWCKEQYKEDTEDIDCIDLSNWMLWCYESSRDL